ncbi:MAG: hypothetical protein A2X48_05410 [Lentisphaerae bacterium GWF2_49_21]|nr:MAG: hypothetical protein A2X48_05410 [Lentisphaerae bacterium GWF2_49_21]
MRRLQEGSVIPGYIVYGGFWVRTLAKILDWIIIGVIQIPFTIAYVISLSFFPESIITALIMFAYFILSMVVGVLFNIFFLTKYSATPGKMAFGLGLINADGTEKISWQKSMGRYFAEILGGMMMYIGYIIVVFDKEKRALHDYMCKTRVVYKR